MRFIRRLLRKFILFILLLAALAIFINAKTSFFRNLGSYLPMLSEERSELITQISDRINEVISQIPTPEEFWASIHHTELPIDPEDIAANTYYSSDTMLNFYNADNISVSVSGSNADVYGISSNPNSKHLVYRFLDKEGNVIDQFTDISDPEGQFRKIMTIPRGSYQLAVFTGAEQYGNYISAFYNYVFLEQSNDGTWSVSTSPVYSHNLTEYEKDKSTSRALKSTYDICSDNKNIKSLADSITTGISDDYNKALALHDWICTNIYYDTDSVSTAGINTASYVATDVLNRRKAVCLGFSNLYAALCRSVSIPCNVVTGYAIGVEGYDSAWDSTNINTTDPNHAWNEIYVNDRRIIVDTTWDTQNKLENGVQVSGRDVSHLYFDANLRFFSQNHKIIEYLK